MVQIIFSNTFKAPKNKRPRKVFRAKAFQFRDNCVYGEFPNGKVEPIATGMGNIWHVGDGFYNRVEVKQAQGQMEQEEQVA